MFGTLLRRAADTAKVVANQASEAAKRAQAATSAAISAANLDRLQEEIEGSEKDSDTGAGIGAPVSGNASGSSGAIPDRASSNTGGAGAGAGVGAGAGAADLGHIPSRYDDLDFTYITERIIAMGSMVPRSGSSSAKAAYTKLCARFLHERHDGRFMVINLSETSYDYSLFDEQVMEYKFPGHPAPPLGMLCKMCTSIESWLAADPENVVVVHCMTGRGRTMTVLSCYLAWIGEYVTPLEALMHVCEKRGLPMEHVIVASQSRYAYYFTTLMDGIRPRGGPLVLRRVILNGVPDMSHPKDEDDGPGCRPCFQLFHCGKLLFSTGWSRRVDAGGDDPVEAYEWYRSSDGSIKFDVNIPLQGDVLMRCRHKRRKGKKSVSIFRAAFHTGYTPELVLRFSRSQLEGMAAPDRYPRDFFVELIFAPVDASGDASAASGVEGAIVVANEDRPAYDAMLAKKSRFWDDIARRKATRESRLAVQRAAEAASASAAAAAVATTDSANSGTVGGLATPPARPAFTISDDDEPGDTSSASAGRGTSTSAVTPPPAPLPVVNEADAVGGSAVAPPAVPGSGSAVEADNTTAAASAVDDELDTEMALLEQELGLEGVLDDDVDSGSDLEGGEVAPAPADALGAAGGGSGEAGAGEAVVGGGEGVSAEEQEILELERYLDSLDD